MSTWTFASIPDQTGRVAIVTGANTGIGFETARALAKKGATVALEGWNLPKTNITLDPGEMKPGVLPLSIRNGDILSNTVPFAVDSLPECMAEESISAPATAQKITLPIIVNGRIGKPGSWDVFQFEGKRGQNIVAEVRARRLDSPLDSVLKLTDAGGKVLAFNDDWEDKAQGLDTHHADSYLRATLPADGAYYVHIGDGQGRGSVAHAYRLRVSAPHPDFELRVTPCSINARPGSTLAITVHAVRKDGFAGEINLAFTYSPVDFALDGAKVPAGQDMVRVALHVPTTVRPRPVNLVLEGRALIDGKKVVRVATPAEDMMQAFIYHHLVPANDLLVTVSGSARARFAARLLDPGPIKLRAGGTAQVRIAIPRSASAGKIELILSDPPDGISLKKTVLNEEGAILLLYADGEKVKPGLRGNLIVEAYPDSGKGAAARARTPLGALPAIPFEVMKLSR